MRAYSIGLLVTIVVVMIGAGCTGLGPKRKAPSAESPIVEENIGGRTSDRFDTENQAAAPPAAPAQSGMQTPVSPYPETYSDPTEKSPRRFKWNEKKGSQPGWETAPTESAQPAPEQ